MVDSLSGKLLAERNVGTLPGIRTIQGFRSMNHSLFTDDSIFLGEDSLLNAKNLKFILQNYCEVSGGLFNYNKISIYCWNIDQGVLSRIANILGMQGFDRWEKFKYLVLPISVGLIKGNHWNEVVSKIQAKINFWGGRWLNPPEKLVLINSVLCALPVYQFSVFLAPKSVTDKIYRLIRDFLWRGGKGNKKNSILSTRM